jgi:transposase-like protein
MEQRQPGYMAPCAYCKVDRKFHRVYTRKTFSCDHCGTMISPMAGTIFEKSSTSLRLWFYAMYLMSVTRCGISAKQIQRETGVTYKTAWRMFREIRTLMSEDISLEGLLVEADETYVGGKEKNKHASKRRGASVGGRSTEVKTAVFGLAERGGRVLARVTRDVQSKTLLPIIAERILPESTVFTDEYPVYEGLHKMGMGYEHRRVNHAAKIYVMGDVHTNSIEGFWSLLKRGLGGVYHSVSAKYLQTYCDEYSYRYNRRMAGQPMFTSLLSEVVGRAE